MGVRLELLIIEGQDSMFLLWPMYTLLYHD